jgi:Ca2+/Na+ antiporter
MIFILVFVVGLVAWALHLMQKAVEHREFSLMLAGFLVSAAAAAMMSVYFLMGPCIGYLTQSVQGSYLPNLTSDLDEWVLPLKVDTAEWTSARINAVDQPDFRF